MPSCTVAANQTTGVTGSARTPSRLFFDHSLTPGAAFCEIREQIGGTAPVDPETMPVLAIESRSPHRNDFQPADIGKVVYYAMSGSTPAANPGRSARSITRSCRGRPTIAKACR